MDGALNLSDKNNIKKLGLSIYFGYHDSCVTFYSDKKILLHLEAERVFRKKHMRTSQNEMQNLISVGLKYLNLEQREIDEVLIAKWNNQFEKGTQINGFDAKPILTGHHENHIGTGFVSGYEDAIIICADGGSEDGTTKIYLKNGNEGKLIEDLDNTIMTGKFYGTITQMIIDPRFGRAHDTYPGKTMGLAALGQYRPEFDTLIREHADEINKLHINGCEHLLKIFGMSSNYEKPWLDKNRVDLAFTAQKIWQETFYKKLSEFANISRNIILVGGCAYNVSLNSLVADTKLYKNIYVTPVSGDCGQSLGAAIYMNPDISCDYPFLGRAFGEIHLNNQALSKIVDDILQHKIIAWYQDRSEVGPRALGNRSFLGLPDSEEMRQKLSIKVKKREPYRPVAPIITLDDLPVFFDTIQPSPYMTFAPMAKQITKDISPAIVHFDGTSRVQTISKDTNPIIHELLVRIKEKTGAPILMNSSFNTDGEPIVDTPVDAMRNFKSSGADILYINGERYET
ncbi:carbamoyl transferase NodU family protein [Candidatus Woesearchaeota archaeon]|nr:carbamoyl transferase NodU family protein [Candidatus Woesearchaeota archaeon]